MVIDCSDNATHGTLNEGAGCFEVHDKSMVHGAEAIASESMLSMNMKQQSTRTRDEMI